MVKKVKKVLIAMLTAITMVTGIAGCSTKQDNTVVVVDGIKISEPLYKTYLWSTQQFFEQLVGPTIWDMELEGRKSEDIAKERALESVVLAVVTTQKAEEFGLELTKEEKKAIKEDAKEFVKVNSDLVKAHGFGEEEVEDLLVATELSKMVQIKIGENYVPNEEEMKKFIEEAKPYYEKVTARHILIKTTDDNMDALPEDVQKEKLVLAQELLTRVKSGEDIGALAAEYSEDPGSANKNGEYTFGRGEMVAEFETAAFEGKDGEIWPELVDSIYGYHIVQTISHTVADEEKIKEDYTNNAKMNFANNEFEELINNTKVEKTEAYDQIKIVRAEVTETIETTN